MKLTLILLVDVLIAGFAALYIWVLASQLHTPLIRPIQKWLRRGWRVPFVGCPWCSGFWLSAVFVIAIQWGRLDFVLTPLSIFAAAALCGFVGALTPGIDLEDE